MEQSQRVIGLARLGKLFVSFFSKANTHSIGRQLLLSVLVVSSVFVVVQTFMQLKSDYDEGVTEIDKRFNQIELSYVESLSKSLWEVNSSQVLSIIKGIKELPDVIRVVVNDELRSRASSETKEVMLAEIGSIGSERYVSHKVPIKANYLNKEIVIGYLTIYISLDSLYDSLYGTVSFILVFQIIKTFLMSAFILAIFHYLVTRHLIVMAKFSSEISFDNLDKKLVLERDTSGQDEISVMLSALNETKTNLKKLLKTNQDSLHMGIMLEQQGEREDIQRAHSEQIQDNNSRLEQSNSELESTIEELKRTRDKLVNVEKMAALGGMVQGVAHELNTPIGLSITGVSHIKADTDRMISMLENGTMKKSELQSYLNTATNLSRSIMTSLDKAASLIRSFKLVSAEQHEETKQSFNVHDNLSNILHSINRSLTEKGISIDNNIELNLSLCSFPGVFYQIYTNLINNALLHAFEGRDKGKIEIDAQMKDHSLQISFRDDGCGMSSEVMEKLFDPFFTTKRARGGTGLGMNIIYNLVHEKLLGSIKVDSEEGAGTIFTIEVPNLVIEEKPDNNDAI